MFKRVFAKILCFTLIAVLFPSCSGGNSHRSGMSSGMNSEISNSGSGNVENTSKNINGDNAGSNTATSKSISTDASTPDYTTTRKTPNSSSSVETPKQKGAFMSKANGVSRLYINGSPVQPTIFCADNIVNLDFSTNVMARQTKLAAENGVKLFRCYANVYRGNMQATIFELENTLASLKKLCSDPYIILYFRLWEPDASVFGGTEYDMFIDQYGNRGPYASMASDKYLQDNKKTLGSLIDAIQANPNLADRVIGYFPSGNGCEWFLLSDGRYDCSGAAQDKFRAYIKKRYGNENTLRQMWGNSEITFDRVRIPTDVPGGANKISKSDVTLFLSPSKRIYRDFFDYYNDVLADFILSLAQFIKQKTNGKSLVGFYYGYNLESSVSTPLSGVYNLERILTSQYIDFIGGPVSYADRNAGGVGMSMTLLSSVTANGKLWIDEADYRSHIKTAKGNDNAGVGFEGGISSKYELLEIIRRQYGKQFVYNSGVWFLDLIGKGWWDDSEVWAEIKRLTLIGEKYASYKSAQTPEVVLAYDSKAISLLGDPWNISVDIYQNIRDNIARTGLSFGLYTIQDVAEGLADGARLYIMMTPWRIDSATAAKLEKVLHKDGVTTLWLYGRGETTESDFRKLTGITIREASGSKRSLNIQLNGSAGAVLPGMNNGTIVNQRQVYQYYYVDDTNATALGTYAVGGHTAVASYSRNGWKSIFYGGFSLPVDFLRSVAVWAGATVYVNSEDVVYADRGFVVLHASSAGTKVVTFPYKCDVYDYFAGKWYKNVNQVTVSASRYQTFYFFYGKQSDFKTRGIG